MPDGLPFNPFEVRDDSNPSGDGLSHLNQIKLGGAATAGTRARFSTGDDYNHTYFQNTITLYFLTELEFCSKAYL